MLPRPIIAITLVVAFISQGVFGQSTSLTPTLSVFPSSTWTLSTSSQDISTTTATTEVISSTPSGSLMKASVTTMNPATEATTEAPTTTKAPSKTCGLAGFLWRKRWNIIYDNNKPFNTNTTEKVQMFLEHGLFNDSSKYGNVKVSNLRLNDRDGYILVEFKLCLVVIKNNAGFIFDAIKMWKTFGNENVTGHAFDTVDFVTFGDWKAKDGECNKCSSGGGGPITVERECEPKAAEYSCNGMTTMSQTDDCLKFCGPSAATRKFTSVFLWLGVLISFSASFTTWE